MTTFLQNNWRLVLEVLGAILLVSILLYPHYASKTTTVTHKVVKGNVTTRWHTHTVIKTKKDKNGATTTTETKDTTGTKQAQTNENDSKNVTKTKSLSRYSLELDEVYPDWQINSGVSAANTNANFGIRIFDLPIFAVFGTTLNFKQPDIGIRAEW